MDLEQNKKELEQFYQETREEVFDKWNRTMPFGELIVDRWEKARFLSFGEKTSIYDSAIVMGDVKVGENTWIGPNTLLDGTGGGLTIGSGCNLSMGVQIYTHDTIKRCLSGGRHPIEKAPVVIGDHCYLAPQCIITKGVTLGKGCLVAAQSLVKDSFESYSILAGTPAVCIGKVEVDGDQVKLHYFKSKEKKV